MSDSLFASPRVFRIWMYTISHRTLLLRSVKDEHNGTRIDLIFKPVRRISLPTELAGVDVRRVSPAEVPPDVAAEIPNDDSGGMFSLSGNSLRDWVVGGAMAIHEDDREDNDPSFFSLPRLVW